MTKIICSLAFASVALVLGIFTANAQPTYGPPVRIATETAMDGFAGSTAISGDTAVISSNAGFHVYVRSGNSWLQQALLVPDDGLSVIISPRAVAIAGDTIVVGGSEATVNSNVRQGAAYVFVRTGTTWSQQQRLTASDGVADDQFGRAVSISNETIVVGAWRDGRDGVTLLGAAYVFVRQAGTWSEQGKLIDVTGATRLFGIFVAVNGDSAAIATARLSGASPAVLVFARTGTIWNQQARLSVCEPPGTCNFGSSIAIDGDTLAIGNSFLTVGTQSSQGGVYVFTRASGKWTQQQRLTASDGQSGDGLGGAVSLSGDKLLAGAPALNVRPGSVYLYSRSESVWTQQLKFQDTGATQGNGYGSSVGISGNRFIAGAPRDNQMPENPIGAAYIYTSQTPTRGPYDFDGDSKTDIGIFRSSVSEWWINRSSNGSTFATQFGSSTDRIVPADYTGDGKTDIAVWRPASGEWIVLRSEDFSFYAAPFGANGDVPVPADYDADGKADLAVFRPASATWFIARSVGGTTIEQFGANGDLPVAADYDGDRKADLAIFRPSNNQWWLNRSTAGVIAFEFGNSTDKLVQGDYTGDGKADVAFWRPSTGDWFVLRSEDFSFFSAPFGSSTDIAAPGDYDGDGRYDLTVFRPSSATWFSQRTTAGILIQPFGATGDTPVANAFVR